MQRVVLAAAPTPGIRWQWHAPIKASGAPAAMFGSPLSKDQTGNSARVLCLTVRVVWWSVACGGPAQQAPRRAECVVVPALHALAAGAGVVWEQVAVCCAGRSVGARIEVLMDVSCSCTAFCRVPQRRARRCHNDDSASPQQTCHLLICVRRPSDTVMASM